MSTGGYGGGKKNANAELNLIPYIDLLSTLICFLLITAVWQQISSISTNGANASASDSPSSPPDPNRVDLNMTIRTDRIEMAAGPKKFNFPFVQGEPDFLQIEATLQRWKLTWPDRKDVTLHSDSKAHYKNLIKMMDILIANKFDDVGVNTQ